MIGRMQREALLMVMGGQFTHAVMRKSPKAGDYRVQDDFWRNPASLNGQLSYCIRWTDRGCMRPDACFLPVDTIRNNADEPVLRTGTDRTGSCGPGTILQRCAHEYVVGWINRMQKNKTPQFVFLPVWPACRRAFFTNQRRGLGSKLREAC